MRRRICRIVLVLLVVTMLATLAAAWACDLHNLRPNDPRWHPVRPTPGQNTAQQLQFGTPSRHYMPEVPLWPDMPY